MLLDAVLMNVAVLTNEEECDNRSNLCLSLYVLDLIASFYSYDCGEPRHVHVDWESKSAKFWLDSNVLLVANYGYSRKELRDIERITRENLERLRNAWDDFCSDNSYST